MPVLVGIILMSLTAFPYSHGRHIPLALFRMHRAIFVVLAESQEPGTGGFPGLELDKLRLGMVVAKCQGVVVSSLWAIMKRQHT